MKLRDTIERIENKVKGWSKPNLAETFKQLWPKSFGNWEFGSTLDIVTSIINQYLDENFLSKNEGAFWLKSVDFEMQELRSRIEQLEEENKVLSMALETEHFSNYGALGLSQDDIDYLDKMVAMEYGYKFHEDTN